VGKETSLTGDKTAGASKLQRTSSIKVKAKFVASYPIV
jgi:hypothetical protein